MPTLPPLNFKPIVSPKGMQPLGARANAVANPGQNRFMAPTTLQGAANPKVPGGPPQIQAMQAQPKTAAEKEAPTCPGGKIRSKGKGKGLGFGKGKGPIGIPKEAQVAKPKVMPHNPLRGRMSKGAFQMTRQQQLKISGLMKLAQCSKALHAQVRKQAGIGGLATDLGKATADPIAKVLKALKMKGTAGKLSVNKAISTAPNADHPMRAAVTDTANKSMRNLGLAEAGLGAGALGAGIALPLSLKKGKKKGKDKAEKKAGVGELATSLGQASASPLAKVLKALGMKDTSNRLLSNKVLSKSKVISLPIDVKADAAKSMRNLGLAEAGLGAGALGAGIALPLSLRKGKGSDVEKEACVRGMLESLQPTEAELQKFAAKLPKGTNVKKAYAVKVAGIWGPILAALGIGTVAPHAISGLSTLASKLFDPYTYIPPKKPMDMSRYGGLGPADENLFRRGAMQRAAVENQTRGLLGAYNQATRPEYYQ